MSVYETIRTELRRGLRWVNSRPSLAVSVGMMRELIPGDSGFGDPMSTDGTSPAQALGRRAGSLQEGRFSLIAELTLAALQLADWLGEDVRGGGSSEDQSILFVDVRGFSQWALSTRRGEVANLLRHVDAIVTEIVEAHGGTVVKRLGDGAMAIFGDCEPAVESAFEAITRVGEIGLDGYRPVLGAGVHLGHPYRIGQDYVGVDVNVAARLCEAAPGGNVLVSGAVHRRLAGRWPLAPKPSVRLRGVPSHVSIYTALAPEEMSAAAAG